MTDPTDDPGGAPRRLFPRSADVEQEFAALSRQFFRFFRWRWRRSRETAEDLAQETVARALQRIRDGADVFTEPAKYFWGVARILDMEEDRETRTSRMVPLAEGVDYGSAEDTRRLERRMMLESFLEHLSPEDRAVFIEYHLGDRAALRRKLRTSEGALRLRVHRIRRRLDALLSASPHDK